MPEKQNAAKPPYRAKFCHVVNLCHMCYSLLIGKLQSGEFEMKVSGRFWEIVGLGYRKASLEAVTRGDVYVSVGDVAKEAKVSRPTARKHLIAAKEAGEIEGFRAAGMWFFKAHVIVGDA